MDGNSLGTALTLTPGRNLNVTYGFTCPTGSSLTISGGSFSAASVTLGGTNPFPPSAKLSWNSGIFATGSLTLGTGATVTLGSTKTGGLKTLNLTSLLVKVSAKLDLADNDLILNYTTADPIGAIRTYLTTGYNSGKWTGTGIDSSVAAADPSHSSGLGYAESSDLGISLFGGIPLTGNNILVSYTFYGDDNLSGHVDQTDYSLFISGFDGLGNGWLHGDFNYDGQTTLADFSFFVAGYKSSGGSQSQLTNWISSDPNLSASQKNSLLSVVPEPTALGTIPIAGLFLGCRRRD